MTTYSTSRSSPGGCVIGVFALIPAVIFSLGIWGMIVWLKLPTERNYSDPRFIIMLSAIVFGGVLTLLLAWFSWKALKTTDFTDYDPRDPKAPKIKW